jgi:Tfp pilus assembly protein PilP
MRVRALLLVGSVALVSGCGSESHQDLRAWMAEQGKNAKGKNEP